ncbi:hypothetical protein DRI50_03500, partial [candidate division KSB1 bacterium]
KVVRSDKTDVTYPFTKTKALISNYLKRGKKKSEKLSRKFEKANPSFNNGSPKFGKEALIDRIRGFLFAIFEFPDKYIGWLPNAVRESIRLIREEKIEAIFTTAPPHSLFLMALLVKKITKVKLILDYRDPWALSRWDRGNSLKSMLEKWLERSAIKAADLCLFVTPKLREEYAKVYGQFGQSKFKVFSNGYDPDDFKQIAVNDSFGQGKDFVRFVHLGTLYKKRDPSNIFLAIAELLNEGVLKPKAVYFDFIGTVARELRNIHELIEKLNLTEVVRFLPPVPFAESLRTMYQADCLLLIQPGTDLQIPAKLFEYMFTRKPILAISEPKSATEQAILEGQLGIFAPAGDVAQIKNAIIKCLEIINQKIEPNEAYIQQFDYSKYIKILEENLESI